jgi:hypothetical protein
VVTAAEISQPTEYSIPAALKYLTKLFKVQVTVEPFRLKATAFETTLAISSVAAEVALGTITTFKFLSH